VEREKGELVLSILNTLQAPLSLKVLKSLCGSFPPRRSYQGGGKRVENESGWKVACKLQKSGDKRFFKLYFTDHLQWLRQKGVAGNSASQRVEARPTPCVDLFKRCFSRASTSSRPEGVASQPIQLDTERMGLLTSLLKRSSCNCIKDKAIAMAWTVFLKKTFLLKIQKRRQRNLQHILPHWSSIISMLNQGTSQATKSSHESGRACRTALFTHTPLKTLWGRTGAPHKKWKSKFREVEFDKISLNIFQ